MSVCVCVFVCVCVCFSDLYVCMNECLTCSIYPSIYLSEWAWVCVIPPSLFLSLSLSPPTSLSINSSFCLSLHTICHRSHTEHTFTKRHCKRSTEYPYPSHPVPTSSLTLTLAIFLTFLVSTLSYPIVPLLGIFFFSFCATGLTCLMKYEFIFQFSEVLYFSLYFLFVLHQLSFFFPPFFFFSNLRVSSNLLSFPWNLIVFTHFSLSVPHFFYTIIF